MPNGDETKKEIGRAVEGRIDVLLKNRQLSKWDHLQCRRVSHSWNPCWRPASTVDRPPHTKPNDRAGL